jgi:uncharacterized membrane protein YgcG
MKRIFVRTLSLAVAVAAVAGQAVSQPPGGPDGGPGGPGKGGPGRPPRYELGQLFPPPLIAELNLTADQEKELAVIQKQLKGKLEKLLTAEQKQTVEAFRPRGPGVQGGPGGQAGPGGGGEKGGPGAKGPPPGR